MEWKSWFDGFAWLLHLIWSSVPFPLLWVGILLLWSYFVIQFLCYHPFYFICEQFVSWILHFLNCTPLWVIIDCIIPWLIINSCKPTSSLTLSLDGYIFVSMFSYSGKIYETFLVTSWLFFLFTYIAWCGVCCLDRKCTYCVWYSCWFDRMV